MTPERYQQIKQIFREACELEADARSAFLSVACADDEELRREVETLLEHDGRTFPVVAADHAAAALGLDGLDVRGVSDSSAGVGLPSTSATQFPERIGHYRIVRLVGQGGMGTVFEAEQENPQRTIALKVIRPGIASSQVLRRFKLEAQVLGRLQHPGIAQVFEAGTADIETPGGTAVEQPFFAMEYIHGRPLDKVVAAGQVSVRQRLTLFAKICDAVHHAHQKGVIHRDLKPGNILVDQSGQPKILDFGVARATDSDVQVTTLQTDVGQLIGTIPYMSPEQLKGDSAELDTRSDVYALGVVLYQMLTGRLPHELRGKTVPEAVRTIAEEEPTPISSIKRVFRGDLNTIVNKALEKERARRYESAAALAADVRSYLADRPISARPPTTTYQLRKFARRNRALVAGVIGVVLVLVAGTVVSTWQAIRAINAEKLAQRRYEDALRQQTIADAVNRFLNEDLLATASPEKLGRDATVREALDKAAETVESRFEQEPLVKATIHSTLGTTYEHLGEYKAAEVHFEAALRLYRVARGDKHLNTFDAMENLALVRRRHARYDEAEELFTEALAGKRELLGNQHFETAVSMNDLATLYHTIGRHEDAERLYLESLDVRRELFGEDHEETAACACNLANLYEVLGRYDEAAALHRTALETRRRTLGEEHPQTLMSMNSLAKAYNSRKEYDRAEPLCREVLKIRRASLGDAHPDTLKTMNNLAVLCKERGLHDESEALFNEVLSAQRRVLGEQHPHTLVSACNLADLYNRIERYEEAAALFATIIAGARESLPAGHWYTGVFLTRYGACLTSLGRFDEAETVLTEACQNLSAALGADHDRTRTATTAMVELYEAWGRPEKAAEYRALIEEEEQ